jgi:hypothetical protein
MLTIILRIQETIILNHSQKILIKQKLLAPHHLYTPYKYFTGQ